MREAPSRAKEWLFRSSAVALGLVVACVAVEAALRLLHLSPVGGLASVTQRQFDRVPGVFMPGQRFIDRQIPALPHLTTIDSLGYRSNGDFARRKPGEELRVLMLGDSFTFGSYVNDSETLPVRLEELLRARCRGPIRVINAGVGGSSIETALPMAMRALPLGVNLAVLTFTENDVSDLLTPMWAALARNRAAKSRFPMSWVYPVVRQSAIWNLLLAARGRWVDRRRAAMLESTSVSATPAQSMPALEAEYRRTLIALRDSLRTAGVPLVFAIFPSSGTVAGHQSDALLGWAERVASETSIPTINYLSVLRASHGPTDPYYLLPHDGHPSAEGYRVAAAALAENLLTLPPIRSHCAR